MLVAEQTDTSTELLYQLKEKYISFFGDINRSTIYLAPASLVFLGDHTHYNEGKILATSVNKYASIAISKRFDDKINILTSRRDVPYQCSANDYGTFNGDLELQIILLMYKAFKEYGVADSGFDCVMQSNVMRCMGLGKHSAITTACVSAMNSLYKTNFKTNNLIKFTNGVAEKVAGKISNSGHYYTALKNRENRILYLDLRTDNFATCALPCEDYKIVVCDTGIEIENSLGICNERIEECEVGVKGLRLYIWGINNLRDVGSDFLNKHIHMIPKRVFNRCLYNVNERLRVDHGLRAIKKRDINLLGSLITESHWSLYNEYELSSQPLNYLVEIAEKMDGVRGSKMISCSNMFSVFNLVDAAKANDIADKLKEEYKSKFGEEIKTSVLDFVEGAKQISAKNLMSEL